MADSSTVPYHYHVYPPEEWRWRLQVMGLTVEQQTYDFSAAGTGDST